ncbi:MAG: class I SAM-dependent methyltransferase [Ignavibacteria bacterium]
MGALQIDIDYFKRGEEENPKFWKRFGGLPDLKNKKILDVGCGHGSMCIFLANEGAGRVIGLELDPVRYKFAKENLTNNYSEFENNVEFHLQRIEELEEYDFDIMVSKDTFEHIIRLEDVLLEMKRRLRPGGKIYSGFGALYNAFNGDHGRTNAVIPWGHLIIPETYLLKRLYKESKGTIKSVYDLGLNKLSLKEYKDIFRKSSMDIIFFEVNKTDRLMGKLFNVFRRIPFLEEYFSYMIHVILRKN